MNRIAIAAVVGLTIGVIWSGDSGASESYLYADPSGPHPGTSLAPFAHILTAGAAATSRSSALVRITTAAPPPPTDTLVVYETLEFVTSQWPVAKLEVELSNHERVSWGRGRS